MRGVARAARATAFGLVALFAAFGGAFLVGGILLDPGGTPAILLAASLVAAIVALAVHAVRRPVAAARVLTAGTAVVVAFIVLDLLFVVVPRDSVGPVGAAGAFVVAVALGFLGLRRPAPAGWLLLLVGVASGGGSGVAVAVPVLVVGLLFLLADRLSAPAGSTGGEPRRRRRPRRVRPVH